MLYNITAKLNNFPGNVKKTLYADSQEEAEKEFYERVESECYIVKIKEE